MEEYLIVIMERNPETGFLEKELGSYDFGEHTDFIVNIYGEKENDIMTAHMKLSVKKDVEDWEFDAIYDYYNIETVAGENAQGFEIEDCFNPTWEYVFEFSSETHNIEEITGILNRHENELIEVYKTVKDKKDEYM